MCTQKKHKTLGDDRRLTGDDLIAMFSSALHLLENNVGPINDLNVFPVPDGDTGTNMFLTLRSVIESTSSLQGASARDVAEGMARGALMGARGNSGVILSQFFKGFSVAFNDSKDFGATELVNAYQIAKEHAYKAVGKPVEGTILTVISSVASAASEALYERGDLSQICAAVCMAARNSVASTPTMLPVLMEAGVVDAGGQGLSVILEGMRRSVFGEVPGNWLVSVPEPLAVKGSTGAVSREYFSAIEEETYGYCTQFTVDGKDLDIELMRKEINELADSMVLIGDDSTVRVHVHIEDPDPVLSYAASFGILGQVDIQDMDEQHNHFAVDMEKKARDVKTVSVVAVALGEGLEALFRSLGAVRLISGGDTMNPSVKELMDAVADAPAENVIVLPNNRNIIPAAEQVAEMSTKTVAVVNTRTVPQGISAMIEFNSGLDLVTNVKSMEGVVGSVKTGEITKAVRSMTIGGLTVEKGDLIGLLEGELVSVGCDILDVTSSVLEKAVLSNRSLVTLYSGDQVTTERANSLVGDLSDSFPESEVELVEGGQPNYHLILSIE